MFKKTVVAILVLTILALSLVAYAVEELEVYTPLNNEVSADLDLTLKWAASSESTYSLIAIREMDTDTKILDNTRTYNYSYTIDESYMIYGFTYKVWIANYNAYDEMLAQTVVYFTTRSNNVGVGYDVNGWYYLMQGSPTTKTKLIGGSDWFETGVRIRYGSSYKASETISAQVSGSLSSQLSAKEKADIAASVGVSATAEVGSSEEREYYFDPSKGNRARVVETYVFVTYDFIREKKTAFGSKTESVTIEFPVAGTHSFDIQYD